MNENMRERLFLWSEKTIKWYSEASESALNNRDSVLARNIISAAGMNRRLCDMGCGLGYLSTELSPYAHSVAAADLNEDAVSFLRNMVKERAITNIFPQTADFEQLDYGQDYFDTVVMCMFGGMEQYLHKAAHWSSESVIYIMSANSRRGFSVRQEDNGRRSIDDIRQFLDRSGLSYEYRTVSTKFGQPFRSFSDAAEFLAHYDSSGNETEIKQALEKRLVNISDGEFSLYLPNDKEYAFFAVSTKK